ncbi:precoat protein [French bean leaf curl virus]|uniref:Protein V2 n=1 Tax=French bean leaf curl virus TaxID=2050584 RepID=I6SW07_9GEMI|nr:precoat protein [French bean leaf curl virus]AFM77720.1 precoat protein [French bean leaf curl virus]
MWDPLLHDFPETVFGLRCMLAVKYLQLVEQSYSPDTLGYDLIRDLISVVRARRYAEATSRYANFSARMESTPPAELRLPLRCPCSCPYCNRHFKVKGVGQQADEQEAQDLSNVQKPGCS